MIGAEHHYNPIKKECLALVFHHPEDVKLPYKPTHSCCLQSQSSAIAHNKIIIAKLYISEMSYLALAVRDVIYAAEGRKRSSHDRFIGRQSSLRIHQTL